MREQLLVLRRKTSGREHPATLEAMTDLAVSYRSAGRIEEAITLQEAALESARRVLPREHLLVIAAIDNLAACYSVAGRDNEAKALSRELSALMANPRGPPVAR